MKRYRQQAQGQRCGCAVPIADETTAGALFGLLPDDQAIFRAQAFAEPQVTGTSLMQAHHRVNAGLEQQPDIDIRAKAPVGEQDVFGLEEVEEFAKELKFMLMFIPFGPMEQGPAGQTEASDEFGDGKAATLFLIGGLRKSPLIFGGIGHGNAGSVNDFNMATAPQLGLGDPSLQDVGRVSMDTHQAFIGEFGSGLAIGAGSRSGSGQTAGNAPILNLSNDLPAGTQGRERLGKECPEGYALRKKALAAVIAGFGRLKQSGRQPWGADLAELAKRSVLDVLEILSELVLSRAAGATAQQAMKPEEKGRCVLHGK